MTVYRPAEGLGIVESDSAIYVAPLPNGPITVLEGFARVIWEAATSVESDALVAKVAESTESERPGDAEERIEAFVAQLVAAGMLVADLT